MCELLSRIGDLTKHVKGLRYNSPVTWARSMSSRYAIRRSSRTCPRCCTCAEASAWTRAARTFPRFVTQLAKTAVPPVKAATHIALSPTPNSLDEVPAAVEGAYPGSSYGQPDITS